MDSFSPIRTLAFGTLLVIGTALMGCGTTLTGPDSAGEQVSHPEQPSMSQSGDAEENDPI